MQDTFSVMIVLRVLEQLFCDEGTQLFCDDL